VGFVDPISRRARVVPGEVAVSERADMVCNPQNLGATTRQAPTGSIDNPMI
jgi:hypothetical protein